MIGPGKAFFREVCERGLEGVVAKRLDSPYLPGKRRWIKFKCGATIACVIVGFVPSGKSDFRRLIIAAEEDGELCCVGKFDKQAPVAA